MVSINTQPSNEREGLLTEIFIDYECWAYGLHNQFAAETDIDGWFKDVKKMGKINEAHFFGSFRNSLMEKDQSKIRTITSDIIDTSNVNNDKDYTDFIILDRIYQCMIRNSSIKQYVIFSGDGHFSRVSAFLKNFYDKIVGIYAVEGTLSEQLYQSSSWSRIVSPDGIREYKENAKSGVEGKNGTLQEARNGILKIEAAPWNQDSEKFIFENLWWARSRNGLIPTFSKTVEKVSDKYSVDRGSISETLKKLIDSGYILQEEKHVEGGKSVRALEPDWQKIISSGIWKPAQSAGAIL